MALGATGGDDAAARRLLLRLLDELAAGHAQLHRASTEAMREELLANWGDAEGGNAQEALVRIVMPRFVPVVVDSSRTIAAAIGGPRFNDWSYRVCRARLFRVIKLVCVLLSFFPFAVGLSTGSHSALLVLSCVIPCGFVANLMLTMLLNTVVLRQIVLQQFDTYWSLINVYTVALCGAFMFKDPKYGVAWLFAQLQVSTYFFRDAAPASRDTRWLDGLALAFYAAFQVYSLFAIWAQVFEVTDYFVFLLGVPVNLRKVCFSAQVNAAIFATRFAVRALKGQRDLMYIEGLFRVRLPAADARELRAVMLAEQNTRRRTTIFAARKRPRTTSASVAPNPHAATPKIAGQLHAAMPPTPELIWE